MLRPWPVISSTELATTSIFRVTARRCVSPRTGREHDFYLLNAPDWINVIPLTEDEQVLMIRQYRHGNQEISLEIPGGMVEASDTSPLGAAGRELVEETGFAAGTIEPIGVISPNPAIQSNRCHSFVATDLSAVSAVEQEAHRDGTEEIEVVRVPLGDIPGLIQQGQITHALVVVAFAFFWGDNQR